MLVVGPEIPAALQPFAKSVVDAITALQQPGKPTRFGAVANAAALPPAADWPRCGILIEDIKSIAVSTPSGSTWAWTRADGSAL